MRSHRVKTVVMGCTAAALAVAGVSASASPGLPSPAQVVAVDCFSGAQVRPGDFLLACGDGNNRLTALHWSSWGAASATGSGIDAVNDCQPDCATGKFRSFPVTVRLDRPEAWRKHPGMQRFTRLRLVYTDSRPAQIQQREVAYQLWD
ncbi:hypothetical protein ACFVXW_10390 [Streptomyces sp. NPDC058251]|uniref:hypothetical protein n=1 Tax=unclassified Streptomyces TaxID=2593676 RepID=UPI0033E02549